MFIIKNLYLLAIGINCYFKNNKTSNLRKLQK